jgi:hypothetical protein
MQMTPVAMITDTEILDAFCRLLHRNRQSLDTIGGGYETTVTIGLLLETLPLFYDHMFSPMQFLIPLHRTEIGCTQQNLI